MRGRLVFTVVTIAIKISPAWFVSNVLFVWTLTFVWNAFLSALSLIVTRAAIHTGLWLVSNVKLCILIQLNTLCQLNSN